MTLYSLATGAFRDVKDDPRTGSDIVNFHVETLDKEGKEAPHRLACPPGQVLVNNLGSIQALQVFRGELYAVAQGKLYSNADGSPVLIGDVCGNGDVSLSSTDRHLTIVEGGVSNNYDGTSITATSGQGSAQLKRTATLDGFTIFSSETDTFYSSSIKDATTIDPAGFSTAQTRDDELVALVVCRQTIFLLGEDTIESWYNAGTFPFPFQRYQAWLLERGVAGAKAAVNIRGTLVWASPSGEIYETETSRAEGKLSTRGLDHILGREDLSPLRLDTYTQYGKEYLVVTLPGKFTFETAMGSGLWHRRRSPGEDHWDFHSIVRFKGESYGVSGLGVSKLDPEVATENGQVVKRVISSILMGTKESERTIAKYLHLEIEALADLARTFEFSISTDRGVTYPRNRTIPFPKSGKRVRVRGLGAAKSFAYRLTFEQPERFYIDEVFAKRESPHRG